MSPRSGRLQPIYIEGTFLNGVQYDMASAIQLMHNMMVAHAKAVIAYKEAGYEGNTGMKQWRSSIVW